MPALENSDSAARTTSFRDSSPDDKSMGNTSTLQSAFLPLKHKQT
jgi:hypothetical protein